MRVTFLRTGLGLLALLPSLAMAGHSPHSLLDSIATSSKGKLNLPAGTSPAEVQAALKDLHNNLHVHASKPDHIQANPQFKKTLTPQHKVGLVKLRDGLKQRIAQGHIKMVKHGQHLVPTPASGKYKAKGKKPGALDNEENEFSSESINQLSSDSVTDDITGDGSWFWNTSYNYWGVDLYMDHNYMEYLCAYGSGFAYASGLPYWIADDLTVDQCQFIYANPYGGGTTVHLTYAGYYWY